MGVKGAEGGSVPVETEEEKVCRGEGGEATCRTPKALTFLVRSHGACLCVEGAS
jgi:hypothetical protein